MANVWIGLMSAVLLFSAAIALMLGAWDVALMFVAIFHSCFQFDKRVVFAYSGTIIALRILLAIPFQEPAMRNAGLRADPPLVFLL
jgi:hypothetical protein